MKGFVNQFVEQEQKELGELPTFQKLEEVVTSFKARPGRLWYLGDVWSVFRVHRREFH